ncbi:hypothetical protein [Streptomyces sp. NPDC057580]
MIWATESPGLPGTPCEVYTRVETNLVVEVLAGSGQHGTLTVTRMR